MGLMLPIILELVSLRTQGREIPEIPITDKTVELVLNTFIDSVKSINSASEVTFHINARVEHVAGKEVIYTSTAVSLGSFLIAGSPTSYSRLNEHLIFWHESTDYSEDGRLFEIVKNQFKDKLINDLVSAGKVNLNFDPKLQQLYWFQGVSTRFVVKDGFILTSKDICMFPGKHFFQKKYRYDNRGYLLVNDGVYHICSLDGPQRFTAADFDPIEYLQQTLESSEIKTKNDILLYITINKKGQAVHVVADRVDKVLDSKQLKQISKAVLEMPRWIPQTIEGKKVCYRIAITI